jgi:uncharacterized protein (UPF0210 family)
MKIRSITVFDEMVFEPKIDLERLESLGSFARRARQAYEEAGLEVQTTRLALDLFPSLARSLWAERPAALVAELETAGLAVGFDYISLGPAGSEMLPYLSEILEATEVVFGAAHLVDPQSGALDGEAIRASARVIRAASQLEEGFGNLRFAGLAEVPPATPFFPAAYYGGGSPSFAIATQAADLAVAACSTVRDAAEARQTLTRAIEAESARIVAVAEELAQTHQISFGGIDFSLAPFPTPEDSIGAALEALSGQPLGAAGTLAAAANLTAAIDQARFPRVGFCGLMLPVLEDVVLAQRSAEGRLRVGELLQWSAVCGTGLDTVPLPGDVSEVVLARLLHDVAALAMRLQKPLTARLMPLPAKSAGDPVHFDFPYFADGGVLPLD